ncbi:MAG: DUF2238 domain-containing protein [Porticoccaceae bacterium]|nr:DUF2238 domain-containing protein [Pseudomonadales bacterium]MCP5170886.1 DUF2238 domain-containing protein [Pseudomonadales bacterium]MCP5301874.1 DUF2238 domain-containing protein [Pseudomonadales bacterium]
MATNRELLILLALVLGVMVWSWIEPASRNIWWAEAVPVVIAIPLLWFTRQTFPLTRIVYYLIVIHAVILLVGAHYTYSRVPIGFWMQDMFDFSRNHYDRIGHIAQGFVPALIAREIFIRYRLIRVRGWRVFLVICFCLAFSAFYELIEWWSAEIGGDGSVDFLGTQGDIWDAQWDMMLALLGAIASQLLLSHWHDRQLAAVTGNDRD